MTRKLLLSGAAFAALLGVNAAAQAGTLYLSTLLGANENPPNPTTYTGAGVLILNDAETQGTITATHDIPTGLLTGGHIHRGIATANGPVVFPFNPPASPVGPLVWNIPAAEVANLKAAGLYFNFHTTALLGGAIRGQIVRATLAPAATTAAQSNLASALDRSAGYDADLDQVLIRTNSATATTKSQALDELSARTVYAQGRQAIETMAGNADSLFDHAADRRGAQALTAGQFGGFVSGGGTFGTRDADVNQAGSTISRTSIIAGLDYQIDTGVRGGVAAGYAMGEDEFKGNAGDTEVNTTSVQAFLSADIGATGVVVDGVAGYAWSDIETTRNLAAVGRTAASSSDGTAWMLGLKASKTFKMGDDSSLVPYVVIDTQHAKLDAYSETGAASAGLVIPSLKTKNSGFEAGAALAVPVNVDWGNLTARLQGGWRYLFEDGGQRISTRLIGSPAAFDTQIEGPGRNAARLGAALTAEISQAVSASLGYRGNLGSRLSTHAIEARFSIRM